MTSTFKLIFASGNEHKLSEIKEVIDPRINLVGMREIGFTGEIDEYGTTLDQNAKIKSDFIYNKYNVNCFSDDTGLEITSLNGDPGVYSARYAGDNCSFDDNMNKVLDGLEKKLDRSAKFRTVINLWWKDQNHSFEGLVEGTIGLDKKGINGFGYDPIFTPNGATKTFAEMTQSEKSKHSHRALATKKLVEFLSEEINS
ncbi:RdgB/HAM1 family non-canonical purine NTP pyrophosphatase [Salibacteraceae bacterium]|nr:RdgB/HAM1 family non-canonical purine NTP pyrophosphatase [Salibacteraceae bacterium]